MEIKSFNEVKAIVEKFPEASRVGYVIAPVLMKIAGQLGLPGYAEAMAIWNTQSCLGERVLAEGEELAGRGLLISWKGLPLRHMGDGFVLGLEETIQTIERILKDINEVKKDESVPVEEAKSVATPA